MPYTKNVFINCPFDDEYYILLKPLIFTVSYLGFNPRLSENRSSSDVRLEKIKEIISTSKYSIHDISRLPSQRNDLPRFNMPFELGLDIGCKSYGKKTKVCVVFEKERYQYQKILSDISGQDIVAHNNSQEDIVKHTRDWMYKNNSNSNLPPYTEIWYAYNNFHKKYEDSMKLDKLNPHSFDSIPISEFISYCRDWINYEA